MVAALIDTDAQMAAIEGEVGFQEGPQNDNPYGDWQGISHAAYCASFANWGACLHGGYRWPEDCQFGWKGDAYCVDDETEILTTDGWKTRSSVTVGDEVLTINPATGLAEWQPVLHVHQLPAAPRRMLSMEGAVHSSLTTEDHRWLVQDARSHRFVTSAAGFRRGDRIPVAAPCSTLPRVAKYTDAFVEIVGWFVTEGSVDVPLHGRPRVRISQSPVANPEKVVRIRASLTSDLGPPVCRLPKGINPAPMWCEDIRNVPNGFADGRPVPSTIFSLNAQASEALLGVAPARVMTPEFVTSLTAGQLVLILDTLLDGDGSRVASLRRSGNVSTKRTIGQSERERLDPIQMICALAGIATNLWSDRAGARWVLTLRTRVVMTPADAVRMAGRFTTKWVTHDGPVWCVTTPNETWLARRHGTTWFTGNCPYVEAHARRLGVWRVSSQADPPKRGWMPLYDWTGWGGADHIGTVWGSDDGWATFWTVEGNTGSPQGVHYVRRDWTYVRGFVALEETPGSEPAGPRELQLGYVGDDVRWLQSRLTELGYDVPGGIDGDFGSGTWQAVLNFQHDWVPTERGGIVGLVTREALADDGHRADMHPPEPPPPPPAPPWPGRYLRRGDVSDDVAVFQARLMERGWHDITAADGWFGRVTDTVVRQFQANKDLTVDGIVGPTTWSAFWTAPIT